METKHQKEFWQVRTRVGSGCEDYTGTFETKPEAHAYIAQWPTGISVNLWVTGPHLVGLDAKTVPPRKQAFTAEPAPELKAPPVFRFDPFAFIQQARTELDALSRLPEGQEPVPQAVALATGFATALASIADSLQRIAKAQETQIALSQVDIDQTIEQVSEQLAQERAEQIIKEKTSRSYIGGKNIT